VSEEVLSTVLSVSHGDMRKAVTSMQSVFTLYGTNSAKPVSI